VWSDLIRSRYSVVHFLNSLLPQDLFCYYLLIYRYISAGEMSNAYKVFIFIINLKDSVYLQALGGDGRTVLKFILEELGDVMSLWIP
jgi:hypothetical protein